MALIIVIETQTRTSFSWYKGWIKPNKNSIRNYFKKSRTRWDKFKESTQKYGSNTAGNWCKEGEVILVGTEFLNAI